MQTTLPRNPIPATPDAPSPFHPTEEAADDIIAAYVDPEDTLAEIARRFKVSIRALSHWLNQPDTLQHIDELQQVTARRVKFIATANERVALNLLISVIEGHLHTEANTPVNTQSLKAVAQRDLARATARLAASQLIRLAHRSDANPNNRSRGIEPRERSEDSITTVPRVPLVACCDIVPPVATNGRPVGASDQDHTPEDSSSPPMQSAYTHSPNTSSPTHESPLREPPCDPVFHSAAGKNEAG